MNTIKSLIQFFSKSSSSISISDQNTSEHLPNAWGRYEYDGQSFEAINNHHFNANSNNERLGWIQNYVNNRLLKAKEQKQESTLVCVNCKTSYRAIS